jgi:two-component system sensor histidine kinase RegB
MQGASSFHLQGMWLAFTLAAFFIGEFVSKISGSLRAREAELRIMHARAAKTEKLTALSTLAAGAAHELGTPLSTIALIAKELTGVKALSAHPDVLSDVLLIRQEVERCRSIVHAMIGEAGASLGEMPEKRTLGELESQVIEQLSRKRDGGAVKFSHSNDDFELPFSGLVESLLNLVRNSFDAQAHSGASLPVYVVATVDATTLRLCVHDHGRGIDQDLLAKLGEPFLTTKPVGEGMGLGVFLAHSFAEKLGGRLIFESNEGTIATLELPRYFKKPIARGSRDS